MTINTNTQEFDHSIAGVPGRMRLRARDEQLWDTQKWSASRTFREDGITKTIVAEVRFDDSCKNKHNSFSITGHVINPTRLGKDNWDRCGCLHDDIAKYFPQLKHLIKWHLCSTDSPMHYVANAVYLAGNRDHWGLLKGEAHHGPKHQDHTVRVGNSPIPQKLGNEFTQWLIARMDFLMSTPSSNPDHYAFEVVAVPHVNKPRATYKFDDKYTVRGYECEWFQCPFDTLVEAQAWVEAFNMHYKGIRRIADQGEFVKFFTVPTLFGEGKERELDAARSSACWPEATDGQLMLPKEELTKLLEARLPKLLADMRSDFDKAGLYWTPLADPTSKEK